MTVCSCARSTPHIAHARSRARFAEPARPGLVSVRVLHMIQASSGCQHTHAIGRVRCEGLSTRVGEELSQNRDEDDFVEAQHRRIARRCIQESQCVPRW